MKIKKKKSSVRFSLYVLWFGLGNTCRIQHLPAPRFCIVCLLNLSLYDYWFLYLAGVWSSLVLGLTRLTVYSVMVRFSATTGYKIANWLFVSLRNSHWLRHISCVNVMKDIVKCPFMKHMSFHDNSANW